MNVFSKMVSQYYRNIVLCGATFESYILFGGLIRVVAAWWWWLQWLLSAVLDEKCVKVPSSACRPGPQNISKMGLGVDSVMQEIRGSFKMLRQLIFLLPGDKTNCRGVAYFIDIARRSTGLRPLCKMFDFYAFLRVATTFSWSASINLSKFDPTMTHTSLKYSFLLVKHHPYPL